MANEGASNGIIHIVDRVLSPASDDIGDILKSNPNFSIFSQMIENAAMNFTNITLFAPTDKAFEVMDRERLETLLSNEECVGVRCPLLNFLPSEVINSYLNTLSGKIVWRKRQIYKKFYFSHSLKFKC